MASATLSRLAPQTHRAESLIAKADRDPADVVLRRTAALLADLKRTSAAARLAGLEKQLDELQAAGGKIDPEHGEARFVLFRAACEVRRQIALANPLLDFEQLLFVKRHRSSYSHMCDQYYGMTARPGGGLYVLSGPLGRGQRLRDVLAESVVENGRLQGRRLSGGSFLSPDSPTTARPSTSPTWSAAARASTTIHTDPTRGHWPAGWCYHVFQVGVDGAGLRQLTDGTWNDFDPCWLPNGRIAFISERRGGYLRCGRECPIYTLYDMAADGSDINCLSVHETNEWHPSVTHDGRIIYTRWDYVDRHGCTAHMPWLTTLDGRDSRAVHGNFTPREPAARHGTGLRAVPGSRKYMATAAAHHGQAFGSLVLIDPHVPDDDAMAPVRGITPDVGFPESQGGAQAYGTAWPLSEDYFLCVYDASELGTAATAASTCRATTAFTCWTVSATRS